MVKLNHIVVIGLGGVGGYFGGKLAYYLLQNNSGQTKISFVARGKHFEKIKEAGLVLTSNGENFVCKPHIITDKIENIETPDLVLLCVKSYDLENSVKQLENIITPHTIVLPLLNGIDIYERIRNITSQGIVLPSCVYVASHITQPGKVLHQGPFGTIICGPAGKNEKVEITEVQNLFKSASVHFKWVDEPFNAIWEKYIFVASFAIVTAFSGKTFVEVVQTDELRTLLKEVMDEIINLAKASNIQVSKNIFESSIEKANNLAKETKTSFQRDVEKGGRNEGDIFGKAIIEKGILLHVSTSTTEKLFNEIQRKLNNQ